MRPLRNLFLLAGLLVAGPIACIPYAVGSTAQPLPAGENRASMTAWRVPRGLDLAGDTATDRDNTPFVGIDAEWRYGIGDGADVGVRVPSSSGVIVNYKRRLVGGDSLGAAALSVMPGVGVVNWLSHAHAELTVMGSLRRRLGITPYAGARVMQVVPLEPEAVHDSPTAGGYAGFRFGGDGGGVYVELGVYHDRSALGMRKGNVIMVPSITADGDLLDVIRDSGIFDAVTGRGRRSRW